MMLSRELQKQALGGLRGVTPQESSPTNGGINVRNATGQGPAASAAKLLAEQRKIVGIFREHKVAPARLDAPVHLGAQITQDMKTYPVLRDVVEIYPEWRGYNYIRSRTRS